MFTYLPFLVGLWLYALPVHGVSTFQFFSDKQCLRSLGFVNGTDDGNCHPSLANDSSAQLVSIDPHCAATIYSDPFCSDTATIANLNTCMSGSLIVGSFSIDCSVANPSAAFTAASGPASSTSTPFVPVHSDNSPSPSGINLSPSTLAGIIAGAVAALLVLPVGFAIWRCVRSRRQRNRSIGVDGSLGGIGGDVAPLKAAISAPQATHAAEAHRSATIIPFFMEAPRSPRRAPSKTTTSVPSRAFSRHSSRRRTDTQPLVSPLSPETAHIVSPRPARMGEPPSPIEEQGPTPPPKSPGPANSSAWMRRAENVHSSPSRNQATISLFPFPPKSEYAQI